MSLSTLAKGAQLAAAEFLDIVAELVVEYPGGLLLLEVIDPPSISADSPADQLADGLRQMGEIATALRAGTWEPTT